MMPEIGF